MRHVGGDCLGEVQRLMRQERVLIKDVLSLCTCGLLRGKRGINFESGRVLLGQNFLLGQRMQSSVEPMFAGKKNGRRRSQAATDNDGDGNGHKCGRQNGRVKLM